MTKTISSKATPNNHRLYQGLCLCAITALISACITPTDYQRKYPTVPTPIKDKVILDGTALPLPTEPNLQIEKLPKVSVESPVISQMLTSAKQLQQQGNSDGAANSLERALRIQPRNSLLWSRLAEVRYQQGNWQQAVHLAAKSNILAKNNNEIKRHNWVLMFNAYTSMGNQTLADKYYNKLHDY